MPQYIDGFLLAVPKRKLDAYRDMSKKAGKVWREYGALEYRECVAEDLKAPMCAPFTRAIKPKAGETIVFSWIVYKSRIHRDRVNAKVMKDPRLASMCDPNNMPFDPKRMHYGGFEVFVSE